MYAGEDRPTPEFYTPEEVAQLLRVSVSTVTRWIAGGTLTAYRPGHSYRVRASDLDSFLESTRVRPSNDRPSPTV